MKKKIKLQRYSARLLFQFRVRKNGKSNRRRVCEERIILFHAPSPKQALLLAKKRGASEEFSYDHQGKDVFFEFIGITDLIELGVESGPDEVWWNLTEKVTPMEKRKKLIPDEKALSALRLKPPQTAGRLSIP